VEILLIILTDLLDSTESFSKKEQIRPLILKLSKFYTLKETRVKIEDKLSVFYSEIVKKGPFISDKFIIFFLYKIAKQLILTVNYPERQYWSALMDITYKHPLKLKNMILADLEELYELTIEEQRIIKS